MKRVVVPGIILLAILLFIQCKIQDNPQVSFKARLIYHSLHTFNPKKRIFHSLLNKPQRGKQVLAEKKWDPELTVTEKMVRGYKVVTIQNANTINRHIILLHGGAYVAEAMKGHRTLMEKLALSYPFRVSIIDYPLAPENQALFTHEIVKMAYQDLTGTYENDTFYLLGDSAGGGLALAFLQVLRNEQAYRPQKTVLLSPWLDVSMSNPGIDNFKDKEVLLDIEGLKECGKQYAGLMDLKDPLISPIYGNLEGLSDILIFVSSSEVFYPDCILLDHKLADTQGTTSRLIVQDLMVHDWVLLPIKERQETIQQIADFLLAE